MTVTEAQATIQAAADDITHAFRAMGYERPRAAIWIGYDVDRAHIQVTDGPPELGWITPRRNLAELLAHAHERIAALPDGRALDPWFDPLHPVNQPLADAAE